MPSPSPQRTVRGLHYPPHHHQYEYQQRSPSPLRRHAKVVTTSTITRKVAAKSPKKSPPFKPAGGSSVPVGRPGEGGGGWTPRSAANTTQRQQRHQPDVQEEQRGGGRVVEAHEQQPASADAPPHSRPMGGSELFAMRCAQVVSASVIAVKGPTAGRGGALGSGLTPGITPAPAPVHAAAATRRAPLIGLSPVEEPAPSPPPRQESLEVDSRPGLSGPMRITTATTGVTVGTRSSSSLDDALLERVSQRPSYAPADDADRFELDKYRYTAATNFAAGLVNSLMPPSTLTAGSGSGGGGGGTGSSSRATSSINGGGGGGGGHITGSVAHDTGDGFELTAGGHGGAGQGYGDGFLQSAVDHSATIIPAAPAPPPPYSSSPENTAVGVMSASLDVAGKLMAGVEFGADEVEARHLRQQWEQEQRAKSEQREEKKEEEEDQVGGGGGGGGVSTAAVCTEEDTRETEAMLAASAALDEAKRAAAMALLAQSGMKPTSSASRMGVGDGDTPPQDQGARRTLWGDRGGG